MKGKTELLYVVLFAVITILLGSCARKASIKETGKIFSNAVVVSAYPDASKVGVEVLREGGNAIDAAVAVAFALEVVYPSAGNIGGGGFMVLRMANNETNALDFREMAPAGATRDMYLDKDGNIISGASLNGYRASGVPGSVDGMFIAHQKYGKLVWKDLVQPAIALARNGFAITKRTADEMNAIRNEFLKIDPQCPYLQNTNRWKEGDTLKQEDLAKTLEMIRDNGREGFYEGPTADRIVAEMQKGGGLITAEDLHNYRSVWRKPITANYKGYEIITMPPPSSGGIALVQLLKMTEPYSVGSWGFHSVEEVHLFTEAENRVYADRARWLGDPDFFNVPVNALLDSAYILQRMSDYDSLHAKSASAISAGNVAITEKEQTTHFSIVDSFGNAVAVTTTLNGVFGSKVFIAGAGFLLNNEMDDFSIKPGVPNIFGLVGGEANAIEPGKRMLSSMTPTIVTRNGRLFMVTGSPGGSTIITTVFQSIVNVIDYGMSMQQAVDAKRFHSQWLPDTIQMENMALEGTVVKQLQQMGHACTQRGYIGCCDAILALPDGGYESGPDRRGDDTADGW